MNLAQMVRVSGVGQAAPPDPGDTLTSGAGPISGQTYTAYTYFPPVLYVRPVHRTPLVDQGDEFIDLQTEFAHPGSPTVTTWTVGGDDVGYFDLTDGRLTFKAATRASIPRGAPLNITVTAANANGTDGPYAYQVIVPADANCRFVSFGSGSDAANGLTPATAKKYMPGATGYTGSAVTYGADICVFFKAERHRYRLANGVGTLSHTGTSGHNMVYALNGWGGRATISGDDDITGWGALADSSEAGGNTDWASFEKIDLTAGSNGGAIQWYSHLFFGEVMAYPAQWPVPADLYNFEDAEDVTEQGGMRRALVSTSGAVSPRISQVGGANTDVTIVDPDAATAFGANDPTGYPCNIWTSGNNVTQGIISARSGDTFTVTLTGTINNNAGYCAYSFTHHPALISEAGQFATNTARTEVIAWRPNTDTSSVSRRDRGMSNNMSYTTVEGGLWERYLGSAGNSIVMSPSSAMNEPIVRNMQVRQCRADSGSGAIIQGNSVTGSLVNPIFEGIALLDHNPRAAGIRFGIAVTGAIDGTPEDLSAATKGYIDGNFFDTFALGRTGINLARGNGIRIKSNIFRAQKTVHGNGISIYGDADDAEDDHHLIENNFFEHMNRAITVSIDDDRLALPRSNYYRRNICLGLDTGFVVALYDGEPDSFFEENIVMGGQDWDYPAAFSIAVGSRVTMRNCVLAGMSWAATLSTATYTVENCLFTVDLIPPADGSTRVSTGNTLATGTPFKEWDGVMTSEMEATLGPGQIGVFWNIAA